MKITDEIRGRVREAVVTYLSEAGTATRAELMDGATARLGLTEKEMRDRSAAGKYYTLRSYVGVALDALHAEGDIRRVDHRYSLAREGLVIVTEDKCEAAIRELLKQGTYTKNALYDALDRRFGTDKTNSAKDNAMLHSSAGSILGSLVKRGEAVVGENGYSLCVAEPKGCGKPMKKDEFKKEFFARLHRMGGPFFEHFLANLLEKYFTVTGRRVLVCEVAGGSNDGGVDVIVDTMDDLGFFEHIMVQAKCRARAHVTEKEVREFYGALTALSGSRGIYATTSSFHMGAQKLLDSLDNCVGLDGDKLFELMEKTAYGMTMARGGYCFDETIFAQ